MDHYPDPLRELAAFNTSRHNRADVTLSDAATSLRNSPMVRGLVADATATLRKERDSLCAELAALDRRHAVALNVLGKCTDGLHTVQRASIWTRVKWVFTGVQL